MKINSFRLMATATVLMLLPAMPVRAQRIGIVAGGTFSQLRGVSNVQAKNRTGTMFGLTLLVPSGGTFALQPELLFTNKGSEFDISGVGTRSVKLDYLEIPLLLRVDSHTGGGLNPHLYAGPSIGFNLGCNVTLKGGGIPNTSSDCKRDNFLDPKSVDWSAIVGAGVDLSVGGIGLTGGARYGFGLADINKTNVDEHVRNGSLTVYAGVLFGHR
jgi:hypothetical protein